MRPASTTPRLPDWPERLAALVEARRHMPFSWGNHDCGSFAADAIRACTGEDPMPELRGLYADEAGAEAMLARQGGLLMTIEMVQARRGAAECPRDFAQRGDTAFARVGNEDLMTVVLGDRLAAPGPDGLVFVPLRAARRIWVT